MLRKMAADPNNKPTVLCGLQYIIGTHDVLIDEHYTLYTSFCNNDCRNCYWLLDIDTDCLHVRIYYYLYQLFFESIGVLLEK